MREFSRVAPGFWIGSTGRRLRGDPAAQLVALYLMTSPHAVMTGLFYCPVEFIAKETGLPLEGAKKALRRLIEEGFAEYDWDMEWVFVVRFAEYQIAASLKPADKRIAGVGNELAKVPAGPCLVAFLRRYTAPFHLKGQSPSEAPSMPLGSQEQEQEQEQEDEANASSSTARPIDATTCPHREIIGIYRELLPSLPQPRPELWQGKRAKDMAARWRWVLTAKRTDGSRYASDREEALAWFRRFFGSVRESDFLTGRSGSWIGCDLGWLMREANFAKVVQGNYTNREAA